MIIIAFFQAVQVAKEVTNITDDNATAIKTFRKILHSQDMYFNKDPIPANEMGEEAFKKCSNIADAERNCPKRWEALQKWFKEARMVSQSWPPGPAPGLAGKKHPSTIYMCMSRQIESD